MQEILIVATVSTVSNLEIIRGDKLDRLGAQYVRVKPHRNAFRNVRILESGSSPLVSLKYIVAGMLSEVMLENFVSFINDV